ncbi:hypothetical protein B0H17DRAFT_1130190 [Mycena rosella]|uniref:CCHC-type domain-containing protein n=1 Tax=Mycena rosella TaxID=1033263 RepID=A0AAD7DTF6_MYCRO|nr:hypothetical protein B0H17DRAFT_1130190 [Mycena rosella]
MGTRCTWVWFFGAMGGTVESVCVGMKRRPFDSVLIVNAEHTCPGVKAAVVGEAVPLAAFDEKEHLTQEGAELASRAKEGQDDACQEVSRQSEAERADQMVVIATLYSSLSFNGRREEGISDDEADELSPFLMVIPSGEKPIPGDAVDVSPQHIVPSHTSTKPLFDDTVAEKNSFRANNNSIPEVIYSLAKNRISPPLTLCLPASLERIHSSNVKTVKHGTGETTKITVIDVSEFPDEGTLDQANFLTCYNTFLTFMEGSAGRNIFRGFATHYDHILSDPDIRTWFLAYRVFDKKMGAQFFTRPYIIDAQYRDALQAAKNLLLMSNSVNSAQPMDASSRILRIGKERSERSKPYGRDDKQHSVLCFRCGRMGHSAPRCSACDPSRHGRNFVIFTTREGLFCIHDQRPVSPALLSATKAMHSTSALFAANHTTERSTVLATSLRSLTRFNTRPFHNIFLSEAFSLANTCYYTISQWSFIALLLGLYVLPNWLLYNSLFGVSIAHPFGPYNHCSDNDQLDHHTRAGVTDSHVPSLHFFPPCYYPAICLH